MATSTRAVPYHVEVYKCNNCGDDSKQRGLCHPCQWKREKFARQFNKLAHDRPLSSMKAVFQRLITIVPSDPVENYIQSLESIRR